MRAGEASLGMDTGRGGDEAGTLHLLRSRHYGLLSGRLARVSHCSLSSLDGTGAWQEGFGWRHVQPTIKYQSREYVRIGGVR